MKTAAPGVPAKPAVAAPSSDASPRTTATARIREVWDVRLRQREREIVLDLTSLAGADVGDVSSRKWSQLDISLQARILIALRDIAQLGHEASYALGYSRRNG